jgi:hypothetical protein
LAGVEVSPFQLEEEICWQMRLIRKELMNYAIRANDIVSLPNRLVRTTGELNESGTKALVEPVRSQPGGRGYVNDGRRYWTNRAVLESKGALVESIGPGKS